MHLSLAKTLDFVTIELLIRGTQHRHRSLLSLVRKVLTSKARRLRRLGGWNPDKPEQGLGCPWLLFLSRIAPVAGLVWHLGGLTRLPDASSSQDSQRRSSFSACESTEKVDTYVGRIKYQ